jgi:hypothetical protein
VPLNTFEYIFQYLASSQDSYDLISSQEDPAEEQCTDQFYPAIIAGPKGSPYLKAGELLIGCTVQ